jgi:APA family basic amino acid/polyamine antiporter
VALADYVSRFIPIPAGAKPVVSIAAIAALTLIHVRGLGPGRLVQNTLAAVKVTAIVVLIALGFSIGHGDAAHLAAGGAVMPMSWLLALVPVMFSYSGWNAAVYVAEEVRDPSRNVPLALALGTVTVVIIYVVLNALYVFALPVGELASIKDGRLIDTVAERLFGIASGNLIAPSPSSAWRPASARWCSRGRVCISRWRATACSCARRARCTRVSTRRRPRSSRRACGAASWCCRARWRSS